MNRREFFGAGAGVALGVVGVECMPERKRVATIPDNEWGQYSEWVMGPISQDHLFVSNKPELELGHSARWKIQRYPGAKWVPIHRGKWEPLDEPFEIFQNSPVDHYDIIEPIITNCDFTSWLLMFYPPVNERKA